MDGPAGHENKCPPTDAWIEMWSLQPTDYCMHARSVAQSCLTLRSMDCRPPISSVHGIFQARLLEWVAISSFPTQGSNPHLLHCRQILYHLSPWEAHTKDSYSAIKKNKVMPFAVTWMKLKMVILSEVSQKEEGKCCVVSLMYGI